MGVNVLPVKCKQAHFFLVLTEGSMAEINERTVNFPTGGQIS